MNYKKIYIIGTVGSGKTTFAKKLSQKLNIKWYELDKVVWDDDNGNIKRNSEEINNLFNKIISNESYIIEDVGRNCFKKAISKSDIIYYIKITPLILYFRIIKRWIKQKLGFEKYNYKPTLNSLFKLLIYAYKDTKNKYIKINEIKLENKNLVILSNKDIKNMI